MDTFTVPHTLAHAVHAATAALTDTSPAPRLDAEALVRHVSGATRADTIAHPDRPLADAARAALAALVERRRRGEPVAYLTGRREFWSLDLAVSPATLIPRPETELLVERALVRLPPDAEAAVADLGTGSGAVALAIAGERARAYVAATDCSADALAVARANAQRLGIPNVEFLAGDWLAPLHGRRFRVVASNPPYVRSGDPHLREGDLRFEPPAALVGGRDGLDAIRSISGLARRHLEPGGWLLLEHGFDQAAEVRALLLQHGFRRVCTYKDLAGNARITEGQAD